MAGGIERQAGGDPPAHIDHRADTGIGGAHHRQAELDGAKAGLDKVLVGAGEGAEPGVVGKLQDPVGPARGGPQVAREDRLVADQRQGGTEAAGQLEKPGARSSGIAVAVAGGEPVTICRTEADTGRARCV